LIDALRDAGRDGQALDAVKQTRARFKDQPGDALALFAQAKIHLAKQQWTLAISDLEELQKANDLGGTRVPGGTVNAEVAFLRAFAMEQLGRTEEAITSYLAIPEGRNEYYGFLANQRLQAMAADAKWQPAISARLAALQAEAKRASEAGQGEMARRALQSSLRLAGQSQTRHELLGQLRQTYETLAAYRIPSFKLLTPGRQQLRVGPVDPNQPDTASVADELLFLGLYDEGTPELVAARGAEPKAAAGTAQALGDLDYTIAIYSMRGDLPNPAVRFAESVWRTVPADYVVELAPRELIELLYPAPHRNALLKEASPRSLDPRFVLSIARQESRFKADAKSVAAARGLMQFISATADDVAKQLGRRDFRQDDLYDPTIAIQFGSQYLQSLFKQFPAMPEAVAASYNGGADNMARWIARSHVNDPGRYVAEIGFAQTKDYVFRVMTNYWIYQQLYSDQLQKL
jgi:soluble lytic murein transglycosylase